MTGTPSRADRRLWVTDAIDPAPEADGYRWSVEAVGPDGFNKAASGVTATFWGARRKVRRYTRQWLEDSGTRRPRFTSAGRGPWIRRTSRPRAEDRPAGLPPRDGLTTASTSPIPVAFDPCQHVGGIPRRGDA